MLGALSNLKLLDLANNNITGSIPAALRANIVGNGGGSASFAGNLDFADWRARSGFCAPDSALRSLRTGALRISRTGALRICAPDFALRSMRTGALWIFRTVAGAPEFALRILRTGALRILRSGFCGPVRSAAPSAAPCSLLYFLFLLSIFSLLLCHTSLLLLSVSNRTSSRQRACHYLILCGFSRSIGCSASGADDGSPPEGGSFPGGPDNNNPAII